jgi:L-alanine-DL-glutamate epimerase-like enolase superfamily enzyme
MITLSYRCYTLPLAHPFSIARETFSTKETLIVQLHDEGLFGYGEAPSHAFYGATIDGMTESLAGLAARLARLTGDDLEAVLALGEETLRDNVFARAALDMAAHDLWARRRGVSLAAAWGLNPAVGPMSSFTIGIDEPAMMASKLREAAGWPIYKIKLGGDANLETVRQLRHLTSVPFRIDANGGWTVRQARTLIDGLAELGVELVEQPLPPGDPGMVEVCRASPVPVFADESCRDEDDLERCAGLFDGVVLKLVKCGGLAAARRMIDGGRRLGLRLMIGCMTESTVGISAAAQLVPLVDLADIDGAALLAADIATGVCVKQGQRLQPQGHGLGVELLGGPLPLTM